ncbi:MAG: glycosyltransferase [Bacteroidota bacterium]
MKIVKFFITPVYPYGNDHYYHEMIALAEGFQELGFKVIGNCNYWWQPEYNSFLIPDELSNNDFDIAIYDYRYVTSFAHLLFRKGYPNFDKTKKHILVDRNDWIQPIWWKNKDYDIFDVIFAGNIYNDVTYANNIKPWAIGLTNRIIKSVDTHYNSKFEREKTVGTNFRVDHNMRGYLLKNLKQDLVTYPVVEKLTNSNFTTEKDSFYYKSSTRRHNPDYYKILCEQSFFLAFGGYYEFKPFRYLPYSFTDKVIRKPAYWRYKSLKRKDLDFSNQIFIFQHDNFRFWEVLYSGSIAINLDLEYWKFLLPAMPISGEHYLGIKKLKKHQLEDVLKNLGQNEIDQISRNAQEWVFENYSSKAQAQRILNHVIK